MSSDDEFERPVYVPPGERTQPIIDAEVSTPALAEPVIARVEADVLSPQPVDDPRDVDDSDAHVDSPLDVAAWRLRELVRLQRDAALGSPAEADAEDAQLKRVRTTDAPGEFPETSVLAGLPMDLARNYHAGAFFQDGGDARTAELLARDLSEPTTREVQRAYHALQHPRSKPR